MQPLIGRGTQVPMPLYLREDRPLLNRAASLLGVIVAQGREEPAITHSTYVYPAGQLVAGYLTCGIDKVILPAQHHNSTSAFGSTATQNVLLQA